MAHPSGERGITLIEITIVLTVVAILTAAAAPLASRTVERSRQVRALEDLEAIATAVSNYVTDAPANFRQPHVQGDVAGSAEVDLLVSDGDTPPTIVSVEWDDPVGQLGPGIVTDFLENHVLQNEPFDDPTHPYGSFWRGAYINGPIDPDPWGNRYAVNAEWLDGTAAERRNDTFVLSAGPNEQTDTAWQLDGAVAGDDDLIIIIRRDTNLTVP
jgi:prepilin-type N-terminal cleavage/methylation domain-containing protein